MVDVSIIIVNYNVRQFVLQCIHSIYQSEGGIHYEVIVVDNASKDGSVAAIAEYFPEVKIIANTDNPGFSKANNQGINLAQGRYILLLNPDTVIAEDTLKKSIDYMNSQSDIGALGVKMVDGTGVFLPESKRSFPTPWNSFAKLIGLSSIFPNSKWMGGYNLTYVPDTEVQDIDVLCGAFMLMRKTALDQSGLLDEAFFMYGEDVDLSYRIKKAGYRIVYFPETSIIHYKGESTKKSSLSYVHTFYNAMIIYVKKHYSGGMASLFVMILSLAIYFRAGISLVRRLWDQLKYPLVDACLLFIGLHGIKLLWASYYFKYIDHFENSPMNINIGIYTALWVFSLALYGHYSKISTAKSLIRGLAVGTVLILVIYALLPTHLRSSRAIILLGAVYAFMACWLTTIFWNKLILNRYTLDRNPKLNVMVVANEASGTLIKDMLCISNPRSQFVGRMGVDSNNKSFNNITELNQLSKDYKVSEIIFASTDLTYGSIIKTMITLGPTFQYKIGGDSNIGVIGSNSKDHSGEYYTSDLQYRLDQAYSLRQKRAFDVWSSVLILLFAPLVLIINRLRLKSLIHTWRVLRGEMTWISYIPVKESYEGMPSLKPAVISLDSNLHLPLTLEQQRKINQDYARFYEIWDDQALLLKNINRLHIIY